MTGEINYLHCRVCGVILSIEEVFKAKDTCPVCGKKTSWLSDPELMGFDEK